MAAENKNHPPKDDCCPICLDSFEFPCQTNCGHWYCGSCFVSYWRYSDDINWCNCPMCGSLVNKLIPYYWHPQILITAYNYQYTFRWFLNMVISEDYDVDDDPTMLTLFFRKLLDVYILVSLVAILSNWFAEILQVTLFRQIYIILGTLLIIFACDDLLFRPRRRRHERRLDDLIFDDDWLQN